MRNKQHKKLQRKINTAIHCMNEQIARDNLWKGRFYARQKAAHIHTYEDKSGVWGAFLIELVDQKTNKTMTTWLDNFDILGLWFSKANHRYGYRLVEAMNNFIIHYIDAWSQENPWFDKNDYTKDKRWSKK